jgi:hypothetical protein
MSEAPQRKWQAAVIVGAMLFGVMAACGGFVWFVGWFRH